MAKNNNLTDFMVSVANAIRTKKGTSGAINPQNFDSEILSIEGMPSSTKALANVVSGVTPTDEITLNNALAVGLTDTPETATFTERTTADGGTIKDTIARIDKVKGNCVKYNQQVRNGNFDGSGGYDNSVSYRAVVESDNKGTITSTATANASIQLITSVNATTTIKSGHKYLVSINLLAVNFTMYDMRLGFLSGWSWQGMKDTGNNLVARNYSAIITATGDANKIYAHFTPQGNSVSVGDSVTFEKFVCFDLTAIYGSGNEPTTADAFANDMGYASFADMPFLPYSAETKVLTNSQNSVTSKSANLLHFTGDLETTSAGVTWKLKDSHFEVSGTATGFSEFNILTIQDFIPFDRDLYISRIGTATNISINVFKYDSDYRVIGSRYTTLLPTSGQLLVSKANYQDAKYVKISFKRNNNVATSGDFYMCVSEGGYLNEYHPYFAPDNLPTNARNLTDSEGNTIFPNGMQSNGSTYDEWDMAKGKVVKRIANDGTILATPLTYNVPPQKAYYKVSQNGKEIANSTELSAPFKADIAYRGMSAEDLINELNG